MVKVIRSISENQHDILANIITLHTPTGFDCDPTYGKGNFYTDKRICKPSFVSDLYPREEGVLRCAAECLPLPDESKKSIIFDPPFIVGFTTGKPAGIMGERFGGFRYISDLWQWYTQCLHEFYRILEIDGTLVIKCQDTVSSGKQWLSHVYLIQEAEKLGFYAKDLFILTAKNRMIGHNHKNQKHARKFHCYFLVFVKRIK